MTLCKDIVEVTSTIAFNNYMGKKIALVKTRLVLCDVIKVPVILLLQILLLYREPLAGQPSVHSFNNI